MSELTKTKPLPFAWQPLTFRGVAAFAQAKIGRLFLVQLGVAALVAGAVCWFLSSIWFPTIRKAIRQLPETGVIHEGRLNTPRAGSGPLVETRFLSVLVDTNAAGAPTTVSDLRLEFRHTNAALCGLVGCLVKPYPTHRDLPFNRPDLESTWGAWQPMFFGFAALGVVALLFVSWVTLATIYFPVPWLLAYFKDRHLTAAGAWKLAGAALMPGALLAALGVVLYGLGWVDLLRVAVLWALHLPLGWVYLACAPLRLPRAADAIPRAPDPFSQRGSVDAHAIKPANPFADAPAGPQPPVR